MSSKKISLPSVPKNADRDTTVFLQSLKKAVEKMSADELVGINKAVQSYVLRSNKKIRADLVGVIGDETGVGPILDKIRGQITESELSKELGTRIKKINTVENAITEERKQRVAELLQVGLDLEAEVDARTQAIKESSDLLQLDIDDKNNARIEDLYLIGLETDGLKTRAMNLENGAGELQRSIDAEAETRFNLGEGLAQDIVYETEQRELETGTLTEQFSGLYAQANPDMAGDNNRWAGDDSYFAGVWSLQSARIEDGLATASKLDVISSNINDNKASIIQNNETLVTKSEVVAKQINTLSAQMVGDYEGNDLSKVMSGLIYQERTVRADETSALAEDVSLLSASAGDQFDSFKTWDFKENTEGWVGGVFSDGSIAAGNSVITSPAIEDLFGPDYPQVRMRITRVGEPIWSGEIAGGNKSIAIKKPVFSVDNVAFVVVNMGWVGNVTELGFTLSENSNAENYYLVDWVAIGRAQPGASNAMLLSESRVRAENDYAISEKIDLLDASVFTNENSLSSTIFKEMKVVSDLAGTAASDVEQLASSYNDNMFGAEGVVSDIRETAANASAANARRLDSVSAQVNPKMAGDTDSWAGDNDPTNGVGVWSERSARMESDFAVGNRIDVVAAKVDGNEATITQVNKTLVTKNEVVASQVNRLSAQMTGDYEGADLTKLTSGLIYEERKARASDVEGLAEQISLLSAGVGEQFDSFEIWHFNKNMQGWIGGAYHNGYLRVQSGTVTSPAIEDLDGDVYKHVKLRIKKEGNLTWVGKLSYNGGSKTITEPSYDDDGVAIVNWQMEWSGDITSFGLELASSFDGASRYLVDWIAIGRPSPGASNAALLREASVRASETSANASDLLSLNAQLNGGVGVPVEASIVRKLEAVALESGSTAEQFVQLKASYSDEVLGSEGIIAKNQKAAADASGANAQEIGGVFAQVNPKMAGDTDSWAGDNDPTNGVGVWSERSARMELGIATAENFDAMSARVGKSEASIATESKIRSSELGSLAMRTDTLVANYDENKAAVQKQIKTISDDTLTLASDIATVQTTVDNTTTLHYYKLGNDYEYWVNYAGSGEVTTGKYLTIGNNSGDDQRALIRSDNIPLKSGVIYKVVARFRQVSGLGEVLIGVAGVGSNGITLVNRSGLNSYANQTYVGRYSGVKPDFVEVSGYIASSDTDTSDIDDCISLHVNTHFIRPTIIANFESKAGKVEFDWIKIEILDSQNVASIQESKKSIDGIHASWSIKADVNGVVGGLGVTNDGRTVDFIVRAGSFAIQGQSGSKSVPFVSYPDGTIIDGEVIPAGNYLEDTYIRRASIDTLDIKGNAVTVPVSAFTEGGVEVGTSYKTIQSLPVPSDMGHTMLSFNAIFNFPGYARVQSILCRIVKGGVVIADNIEVFFSEARSETRTSTSYDPAGHNHSASFSGGTYGANGYQRVSGNVIVNHASSGPHSHRVDIANDNRNAGTFSLSRHDSTGVAGIYELQMRVSNGDTANLSQRYIHAMTMRR